MCSEVIIKNGNKVIECSSQGELSKALGLNILPRLGKEKDDKPEPDHCLCPIDIKKAARICGYSWTYDFMNYYFTKNVGKKK